MNITFIPAGAGSGKTHRLTELIQQRMEQRACRPSGLIATTYTIKAANELRERIRHRLYATGLIECAERLDEAIIGTVHGVCARVLGRFAFEAGISPRIEVLSEEQAAVWLSQAVEMVCSLEEIQGIQALADHLGQEDRQTKTNTWKAVLQDIVAQARANDFAPAALPAMAQRSYDELCVRFPPVAGGDLQQDLAVAIRTAIREIRENGDTGKGTAKYVAFIEAAARDLDDDKLPWSQWVKLTKEAPGKKSERNAAPVIAIASSFAAHPRFRADIRDFAGRLFRLAGRALEQYQQLKEERGLLDFGDLEHRALELLRRDRAADIVLAGEIDLLVVDEFQDTSPIQLALFLELARRAKEVVWAGDVKQAIYGFRGTDPVLIDTVAKELRRNGVPLQRLGNSYRAVPDLVALMNAVFAPAFAASLGLDRPDVELEPDRKPIRPLQPALEFFALENQECNKTDGRPKKLTQAQYAACVASGVASLLDPQSPWQVVERTTKQQRPVGPADIAVLCRTNASAARVAEAISQRGLPASLGGSGLLGTPEIRLALACLRRLADHTDTLATAEIVALDGALTAEQWLSNRLDYLAAAEASDPGSIGALWGTEPPFEHPVVKALHGAAGSLDYLSPSEALDQALAQGNVFATVTRWGPNPTRTAQRRANLEALRALVVSYEEACRTTSRPATIAGFLFSCDDLAQAKADAKASDEAANAIHVGTYHWAKGLEWPIVVCVDLDEETRTNLWGLNVVADDPRVPFSMNAPLENRRLRYWPWPFGDQKTDIALATQIEAGPEGHEAMRLASTEALRLLYVGLTRARDLLVLTVERERPQLWLHLLNAPWLTLGENPLRLPGGGQLHFQTKTIRPLAPQAPAGIVAEGHWFGSAATVTSRLPAVLTPSAQPAVAQANIGRVVEFGPRLPLQGKPSEEEFGEALHAILAAGLLNPRQPDREAATARVLTGFGLEHCVRAADVLAMVVRFRSEAESRFHPKSWLVEVPFTYHNDAGQRVAGFIDLLLETPEGWVVVDHKTFPGPRSSWEAEALRYSGQLACYRRAVGVTGKPVRDTWIHFVVGGGLVAL